ncbi:hypothetical protein [Gilliamella apicola]|uniref:hypothetical protein n=1 Tax=Gilliamella apicola TaxID=1196095 RepID=UPI00159EE114|nr:hypothetical protein [Gilliamella apicola]
MSRAIYLSPKSAGISTVIYININQHNANGWVEKPNGSVIKLNDLNGDENGKQKKQQHQ